MASFPSIRIEGGLLGPELLDQVMASAVAGQKPADFGLEARRNLTDEIAAAFADARALWGVFQNRLAKLTPDDLATTATRDAWVIPFLGLLGYEPSYNAKAQEVDGLTFAISHRASAGEDAPPVHVVGARQELGRVPPSGRPRLAPHSLLQEYLNRTEHVWGVVTNGLTLRLLRDSTLVRRQAYIEFDLQAIFDEQRFHDFAALYRLIHRTRLPRGMADAGECLLEKYRAQTIEQGGRVREHLRDGVEECLKLLGNGFLSHPANDELRQKLKAKKIPSEEFYRELLRLIYRFLFLLVSEDRGLISPNPIYRDYYGIARLRRMLDLPAAWTNHTDLWLSLRTLYRLFQDDKLSAFLNVAPLNGELFSTLTLDNCSLSNRDLLGAFWHLAYYQEKAGAPARRVNYSALDVEELGSVYESLLEFHPDVAEMADGKSAFDLVFGSERKTTGSYYTPPELVNELVESALVPVMRQRLDEAAKGGKDEAAAKRQQAALLSLKIIDVACGSGHMLLAAARRMGAELARLRTGEEEPSPEPRREAIRDIIAHCIYGVDKNPLAVDLCRVALWLEGHTAGKPLTFLDHRIRPGDSLIGILDLSILGAPIPDAAYKPLVGDNKTIAREVVARNRDESRVGVQGGLALKTNEVLSRATERNRQVDAISDGSPTDINRKKLAYREARGDPDWICEWQAANLWTSAFFAQLTIEAVQEKRIPTTATLRELLSHRSTEPQTIAWSNSIAFENQFFHWPLEFPEVFEAGGFDVVLSNPPWEHVELKEQEFFASRDPIVAGAATKAARVKAIEALRASNPTLHREYESHLRTADASRLFLAESGRFPLAGQGRINTYAVFTELVSRVLAPRGRAGIIVPVGIATDDTTKDLFGSFVLSGRLIALTGYENEEKIFAGVNNMFRFCTLVVGGSNVATIETRFGFFIRKFDHLKEERRFFYLSPEDFKLLNPNTGNCPTFRSQGDAELTKAIHRRVPILWREGLDSGNPWELSFSQGLFNMASDSHHFRTADQLLTEGYHLEGNVFVGPHDRYLPLYEAKMLHQFDHRFSTYEGAKQGEINAGRLPQTSPAQKLAPAFCVQPRYWVRDEIVESLLPHYPEPLYLAIQLQDEDSIRSVLLLWLAGWHFSKENSSIAQNVLFQRDRFELAREVKKAIGEYAGDIGARRLQSLFPLTEHDATRLSGSLADPLSIAQELVARFSPRWLLGWRAITNSANERTTISSFLGSCAVGDTFLLMFVRHWSARYALCLNANLNSYVQDYCARQKVGGTTLKYFTFRQFAVLPPSAYTLQFLGGTLLDFVSTRALELVYTANDLAPLAHDCGYDGSPFTWSEERRFQLRAELNAAFFFAYLGTSDSWRPASGETAEIASRLRAHFPSPKDAAAHVLNSFPITREKDEEMYGCYKTRDVILLLYEAFSSANRTGKSWSSPVGLLSNKL